MKQLTIRTEASAKAFCTPMESIVILTTANFFPHSLFITYFSMQFRISLLEATPHSNFLLALPSSSSLKSLNESIDNRVYSKFYFPLAPCSHYIIESFPYGGAFRGLSEREETMVKNRKGDTPVQLPLIIYPAYP